MDFAGLYRVDRSKKKSKLIVYTRMYLIPAAIVLGVAFLIQILLKNILIFPVKIDSDSMAGFVKKSEKVYLVYPHLAHLKKGDVVYVKHEGLAFFCRIIAQEGEMVQILDKSVFVNHTLYKDYNPVSRDKTSFPEAISMRDNSPEFLNGPGNFFCLNDNWQNIQDSRTWGPFNQEEIRGKLVFK